MGDANNLQDEYPLIKKTLDPPGVCTFYNPNYCSPFTQVRYDMITPLSDYIEYEDVKKTTLVELIDSAGRDLIPQYHIEGLAGDDGFFNQKHYNPDAPGWFGTCHKWCAWQSSKEAVKISSEDGGHVCGKYFLSQGDISEYFTAIYPSKNVDSNNINHFYGGRTNPYYGPNDTKDPEDVKRANSVNLLLMKLLDKMGYINFWPHIADQTYNKYIVEDERSVTTNVDAHSPSIWNQPTFHFERLLNTEIDEELPLLSIFDQKYNYFGPTFFYEGTPNAVSNLKEIEEIDYTLFSMFLVLQDQSDLRSDGKNQISPLLEQNAKVMDSLNKKHYQYIKRLEQDNKHYFMDVAKSFYKKKVNLFKKAKPYLKFKDNFSGIFVQSKIKYLQECQYRAAVNFVREAKYDYYILKDSTSNKTYSMWANPKMKKQSQPDFIAASVCVDDECKEMVRDYNKIQDASNRSTQDKIKQADYMYWLATGSFFKLLDQCVPLSKVKEAIQTHVNEVHAFNKNISVFHSSNLNSSQKEYFSKKYVELREGPIFPNNLIKHKDYFTLIPHHVGGIIINKKNQLIFADYDESTGECLGEDGKVYPLRKCLVKVDSEAFYSKDNKKCSEFSLNQYKKKKDFIRALPLLTCAQFGIKPHKYAPLPPTPSPSIRPGPSNDTNTKRERILNKIRGWQERSTQYQNSIDRNKLRREMKKLVLKLALYDVFKGSPVRYPNLMPFGIQNSKVRGIWMHLDQNIYRWAVRKYEGGKQIRSMMKQNYPPREIEKIGKPIFKELAKLNMKLLLKENKYFALDPQTLIYPSGDAGRKWKYLNEKYYNSKWSKTKYMYYSKTGF